MVNDLHTEVRLINGGIRDLRSRRFTFIITMDEVSTPLETKFVLRMITTIYNQVNFNMSFKHREDCTVILGLEE